MIRFYMFSTFFLFVVLIACSGFFSGAEIAFFSLSPGKIRTMVRHGAMFGRLIERLKSDPRRLLIVILVGNNLVNILAAAVATEIAIGMFGSRGVGIATGIVTFLVLVFGEIFPKTYGQFHAEKISRYSAPVLWFLEIVLWPLVKGLEKLGDLFSIKSPGKKFRGREKIVEEEIRSMFQIGVEQGAIEHHEREFAERLFRFNDVPVADIMKFMDQAVMLDGNESVEDVAELAADSGYSRFPVFEKTRSNIVGIVHIKDILRARAGGEESKRRPLSAISRPSLFVDENRKLSDVFRFMRQNRAHFVLVKNKSGKVSGLVTMEDVMEELVGEIYDESDKRKQGVIT